MGFIDLISLSNLFNTSLFISSVIPHLLLSAGILVLTILLIGLWPYPFVEVIKHGVDPILSGILGAI